jgi:hypothetical protein
MMGASRIGTPCAVRYDETIPQVDLVLIEHRSILALPNAAAKVIGEPGE